ncbi:MAG: transposase [Lewinella sp.]
MINRPITNTLVHLTYALKGSISSGRLEKMGKAYYSAKAGLDLHFALKERHPPSLRAVEYQRQLTDIAMQYYLRYDELLDQRKDGPMFLESPETKKIIIDSWIYLAERYKLTIYAICVMSNHVHLVLRATEDNAEIRLKPLMEIHRRFTSTMLNRLHNKKGRKVWATLIWDRDVRPGRFTSVLWYILNNPKKAGITSNVLDWCGNWWDERLEEEYIRPYRVA